MENNKKRVLNYLSTFITDNKKEKINKFIVDRTRHVTLVLEDIYQSHNASAVLRSTECFGIQDVHVVQKRNRFDAKQGVTMGASKWLNLYEHESVKDCFAQLKKDGYRIVATTPHEKSCTLQELPLDKKFAFVFGTEETGLTKQALDLADEYVVIPMYGFTESFNVSVSVAICLYHVTTQLRQSSIAWQLTKDEILDLRLQWARAIVRGAQALERRFLQESNNE
ncbi:RNA methyltransferase [bacterium]|nr:RNA methyltransferase [bacterium]